MPYITPSNAAVVTNPRFLGEFGSDQLVDEAELSIRVGLTEGRPSAYPTRWLGFEDEGQIKYVAMHPLKVGVSLSALLEASVVNGNRELSIRGERYRIRLLDGADPHGSEWDRLIGSVVDRDGECRYHPIEMGLGRFQTGRVSWCRDVIPDTPYGRLGRGGRDALGHEFASVGDAHPLFGWRPVLVVT